MHKLVIESIATKKGNVFEGIALTPSVSLNHNIYSAEEIDSAQGLGIPLRADMEHTDHVVGNVTYSVDSKNHIMSYHAVVTDESVLSELNDGTYKVSIEAGVNEVVSSCNKKGCYNLLSGLTMEGIGFTRNPGVVTTTLNVVESYQDWKAIKENHCEGCHIKEQSLDTIIITVLTNELDNLAQRIQLKFELMGILQKLVELQPDNLYYQDELYWCQDDLRWMIERYIELKKNGGTYIESEQMKKISELKFDIPKPKERMESLVKENLICKHCGKPKKL